MYVIFPADEVVYLSYGRVIYVPVNPNPDICPIRTNSLPLDSAQTEPNISLKKKSTLYKESIPGTSRSQFDSVLDRSSSSKADVSAEPGTSKSRKKLPKLNFKLLNRRSSSKSEPLYSARVRKSIGTVETPVPVTPPSEAFRKFCVIGRETEEKNSSERNSNSDSKRSSKRSSSSSKTSKQVSVAQEDKDSKKSSKQSSTSSKSGKSEKKSPLPPSKAKIQTSNTDIRKEPNSKGPTPSATVEQEAFYPLATSREKNLEEPFIEKPAKVRSSPFRLSFRRSKTPEVPPVRPERKKEKKVAKPKPEVKRKLSFSDFLVTSREKVELRVEVPVKSDTAKSEKSPVLNFFRKTPSPRNLGCDRTPNINRDSARLNSHLVQIEDQPRPSSSTGHKHTTASGEGSIMRVSIFTIALLIRLFLA